MKNDFVDIMDSRRWQKMQDNFAEVLGASVRVVDDNGAPLSELSNPSKYCFKIIASSPKSFDLCDECILCSPKKESKDKLLREPEYFLDEPDNTHYDLCPFLVNRISAPIRNAQGEVCAYIVIGGLIIGKRKAYNEYFTLSKEFELDSATLIDAVELMRIFSFHTISSLVCLFQDMTNYIVQNSRPAGVDEKEVKAVEQALPFYVNKMLQALFETAGEGVGAERVSIMLLDEATKTLTIRMHKGIPEHVAKNTKVKIGEGLSGWAAQEDKILFIDRTFSDKTLEERMHQPHLGAAVVVPIKSGKNILGVLNLSTQAKKHRFTRENINSIMQLAKLVDVAITNINDAG